MGLLDTDSSFDSTWISIVAWGVLVAVHYFAFKIFYARYEKKPRTPTSIPALGKLGPILIQGALSMALPPLILYTISLTRGADYVDFVYSFFFHNMEQINFLKQRAMYAKFPMPIHMHFYFNVPSLLIGAYQLLPSNRMKRPYLHRILGSLYVTGFTIGNISALHFCKDGCYGVKEDGAWGTWVSFFFMACAVLIPAYVAVYQVVYKRDYLAHREWMIRSLTSAVGGSLLFRLLLSTMEIVPDQYTTWLLIVWSSWFVPLSLVEIFYIQPLRQERLARLWQALGQKDIHSMNLLLSDHQEERIAMMNSKEKPIESKHIKSNTQ